MSAIALMEWRNQCESSECSFVVARQCSYEWKEWLRERQSSMSGEFLVELPAELKTETVMVESVEDDNACQTLAMIVLVATNGILRSCALTFWSNKLKPV
jgi:chitodextrinase